MKNKVLFIVIFFIAINVIGAQQFSRELKLVSQRMHGTDVEYIQRRLTEMGFIQVGEIDGWFGPNTEKGVIQFQRYIGQSPSGVVDENLWKSIEKPVANLPTLQCVSDIEQIDWERVPHTEADLNGYSSEGGTYIRYTENQKDLRIKIYLYGDMGKVTRDFFFCKNGTTVLFEDNFRYPTPFDIENANIDYKTYVLLENENFRNN